MIKKFIRRLLGTATPAVPAPQPAVPTGARVEYAANEHGIDPKLLDDNAVRVVRTLKDAGFEAYIVGGAVRDLLVGMRPKDFDVATDATPEQVKSLFRRAFNIGRRFRNDTERLEKLFELYTQMTAAQPATKKKRKTVA